MKVETIEIYYTNDPGDGGPLQHTRNATVEVMEPLVGSAGTVEEVAGGHVAAGTYFVWAPVGGERGKLFIKSDATVDRIAAGEVVPVLVKPAPKAVAPYGWMHQNPSYYTA